MQKSSGDSGHSDHSDDVMLSETGIQLGLLQDGAVQQMPRTLDLAGDSLTVGGGDNSDSDVSGDNE